LAAGPFLFQIRCYFKKGTRVLNVPYPLQNHVLAR
jgi:hypothetical protein